MSTLLYASLVRRQTELVAAADTMRNAAKSESEGSAAQVELISEAKTLTDAARAEAKKDSLVTRVTALIPAEIIALHTLLLALASKREEWVTTITKPVMLKWSLGVLMVATLAVYLIRKGRLRQPGARWRAVLRAAIPPVSVPIWAGLIGPSALTPWVAGFNPLVVTVVVSGLGSILVFVNIKLANPVPT